MVASVSGSIIPDNALQLQNIPSGIADIPDDSVTFSSALQPMKMQFPSSVTLAGIAISVRAPQSSKA